METCLMSAIARRAAAWTTLSVVLALTACASRGPGAGEGPMAQAPAAPETELLTRAQFGPQDGEAARTEALYISVLRRVPTEGDTWYRLGNLYANNNRPESAAAAYNRALLANNANTRAWHNLAVIRLRQSYAALIQAQLTVDTNDDAMVKRIEELLDQLDKVTVLGEQSRAARQSGGIESPGDRK
jgi:cytochrome c-type biogenesis protein CcmH/NrfG